MRSKAKNLDADVFHDIDKFEFERKSKLNFIKKIYIENNKESLEKRQLFHLTSHWSIHFFKDNFHLATFSLFSETLVKVTFQASRDSRKRGISVRDEENCIHKG